MTALFVDKDGIGNGAPDDIGSGAVFNDGANDVANGAAIGTASIFLCVCYIHIEKVMQFTYFDDFLIFLHLDPMHSYLPLTLLCILIFFCWFDIFIKT